MTIRRLRLIALLGFLLLVAASVAVTFAALQTQRDDALVINLAGRQRMLIQRMTLEVLGTQIGANPAYREALHDTAHTYFESTLHALIEGGQTRRTDNEIVTLPSTRNPEILALLEVVLANWEEMHSAIHVVLDSAPGSSAFSEGTATVERLSPAMAAQMDEVVRLYEAEASRKVALAQAIQIGFLGAAVALLFVVLFLTERWLLLPIDQLGGAAQRIGEGDLDTPLSIAGPGEIKRLAGSFDDMRQNLSASRAESERHTQEQAAHLELSRSLIAQLDTNTILDQAAGTVQEIFSADLVSLMFPDVSGDNLILRAGRGWEGDLYGLYGADVATSREGYAFRSGEPVWLEDVQASTRFACPVGLRERGIQSSLTAPMNADYGTLGTLCVHYREPRKFDDHDVRLLSLVANTTAQAFERTRLHSSAQERLERISALHDIDVAITSTLELTERLEILLEKVTERLHVDAAAVALIDPDTRELNYAARRGLNGNFFPDGLLKVKEGIIGQVAHSGELAAIPDVSAEPRFLRRSIAARLGIISYLAVPLKVRGTIIGVLELATRERHEFLSEEIDFFVTLAGQAAVAIENARLFETTRRQVEELAALNEVASAATEAVSEDALIERVTQIIGKAFYLEDFGVLLLDEAAGALRFHPSYRGKWNEESSKGAAIPLGQGVTGRVAATGQPWRVPDVTREPAYLDVGLAVDMRSELCIPLKVGERVIGAINAESTRADAFSETDERFLTTLAGQFTTGIERARLFKSLVSEQHNTARLYHLSMELAANLNPVQVARRALQAAAETVGVQRGNILTLEEDGEHLRLLAVTGYDRETVEALNQRLNWTTSQGVTGRVVRTRTAAIIPDVSQDADWMPISGLDDWAQSMLSVPLVAGNNIVGALNLLSEHPNFFKVEHLSLVTAITSPVSLSLLNARLFEAERTAREQAELLREAAGAVSGTLDLYEVLRQILIQLKRMLPYDTASILLLGERDGPALVVGTGYTDELKTSQSAGDLLTDSRILRQIALDLQPILITDVRRHPDWIWVAGAEHVRTFLAVPIVTRGRLIGALMIDSIQVGFFNESQARLAQTLAQHMAVAIENAHLYEDLRQRLAELEILADTTAALRKAQSYNEMQSILLAKAVEGLKANAGVLLLLENDALKFAAIHGETSISIGGTCLPGAGMIWQALENDATFFTPDVSQIEELHKSAICRALMGDALSCVCVPLRTTASAIGVVFLNWKKKTFLSADESRLLESLAEIAANAIHRSTLHLQTKQQALELMQAYDATIEGWSHALDQRDPETEGHTQRVTNLTLELARIIGLREPELAHIRRGALLHDIGKIGIPDSILRKSGALTKEEWDLMRQHPQIAYDMLAHIAYLQPALDIPYCHHEKWDGTGYPRGLKGEEIPLIARIFAVADVFDALTSNRPYRPAWTKRKTITYIRKRAGIHFDPNVVETFLNLAGNSQFVFARAFPST